MVTGIVNNPVSGQGGYVQSFGNPSAGTIPTVGGNGSPTTGVTGGGQVAGTPQTPGSASAYTLPLTSQSPSTNSSTVQTGFATGQVNPNGGTNNNGSWYPGQSTTAIVAPNAAAYTPQNAQQLLNVAQNLSTAGAVPGQAQVNNVSLGPTTQYGAAQGTASTYGPTTYNAVNQGATNLAPVQQLNGAQIATGTQNQNASAQQTAINNLNNIATGNGPNAATIAAQQTGQQNLAAQMAAIASAGGNPALAERNAAQQAATNAQATQQAAVAGSAAEQLGAQNTLQSALTNITQTGQAIPLAQAQLAQGASLANQGVQAQAATTQAQITQNAQAANQAATNQALSQGASQEQAAAAGNAAANNVQTLANQQAVNTAAATNANALNQTNLQQGTMNQQTNLANQQALLSSTALNANQQNAALGAQMQQSSYDTAQSEAYQQEYQQAQENLAALASGQGIASMQNTTQLTGAGIGAGAAALSALSALSDKRAKTKITSAKRDLNTFFNSMKVKQPARFSFIGGR